MGSRWAAESYNAELYRTYKCRIRAPYDRPAALLYLPLWWAYELVFLLREDSDVIHASDFDSLVPAILAKRIGKRKLCYLIYDFYTDNLPDGGFQALRKRIRWFVAYLERTGIGFADVLFLVDESRLLRGDFTLKKHGYKLFYEKNDPEAIQFLETLRRVLGSERAFLLRLLENPNLLEQEAFT